MLLGSLPKATVENEPQIELLGLFSLGFLRTAAIFGPFAAVYQMGLASNTVLGDAVVCLSLLGRWMYGNHVNEYNRDQVTQRTQFRKLNDRVSCIHHARTLLYSRYICVHLLRQA